MSSRITKVTMARLNPPELQWSSDEETEEVGFNKNGMDDESDSDDEFPLLTQWLDNYLIKDKINNDQEPDRVNDNLVQDGENFITPMNIIDHDQNDPMHFENNPDLSSEDMVHLMNWVCKWWYNVNMIFIMAHLGKPRTISTRQKVEINLDAVNENEGKPRQYLREAIRKIRYRLRRGITMDSGAANNVMPRRMVRNQSKIRPSPGSLANVHYVAANNGRIPNEGEVDFNFGTNEGGQKMMVLQIAEVNKALGSISYLVDNGYRVTFDNDAKSGRDISMMVHKETGRATRFRRERNVWILDAIIEENDDTHFPRRA